MLNSINSASNNNYRPSFGVLRTETPEIMDIIKKAIAAVGRDEFNGIRMPDEAEKLAKKAMAPYLKAIKRAKQNPIEVFIRINEDDFNGTKQKVFTSTVDNAEAQFDLPADVATTKPKLFLDWLLTKLKLAEIINLPNVELKGLE